MYKRISKLRFKRLRHALSVPFIFGMSIPIVLLDITIEIYHQIAFRLYAIPLNDRRKYIRIDRQKLEYLENFDKFWCVYCGYANGFLAYAVKIAGDTEKYWCGIKHKENPGYIPPKHHDAFIQYGDEEAFRSISEQASEECKLNQVK